MSGLSAEDIAQFGVHLTAKVYFASDEEDGPQGSFDLWLGANEVPTVEALKERVEKALVECREHLKDHTLHVARHDENQSTMRISCRGHIGEWPPEKATEVTP